MADVLIIPAQVTGSAARERMIQRIRDHVDTGTMLFGCSRGELSIHPGSAYAKAVRQEVRAGNLNPDQIETVMGSNNSEAILYDYEQGTRVPVHELIVPIVRSAMMGEVMSQIASCSSENRQDITEMIDELLSNLDGQRLVVRNIDLSRAMNTGWLLKETENFGL